MGRKKTKKILYIVLITLLLAVTALIGGAGKFPAFAETSGYTSALTDLQKDENFNPNDYPAKNDDYRIQVIQIAESNSGELYVYTYQPCQKTKYLIATGLNMALSDTVDTTRLYELILINSNGVFCKYLVKDVSVNEQATRYYNISSILRPFDKSLDTPPISGTVREVPNAVGQLWTAVTANDTVTYSVTESEVIQIKNKYVGHVLYDEGIKLGWTTTNTKTAAHFVAFDTDKKIDRLKHASITFNEREVNYKMCGNITHTNALNGHSYQSAYGYNYGEKVKHDPSPLPLSADDVVLDIGKGNYTWNRIRSTAEFLSDAKNENRKLTSGDEQSLKNTKWVLNFYETPLQASTNGKEWATVVTAWAALFNGVGDLDCRYTEVSDVMILELEFETDGKAYKLGAVDNKQTGAPKPWGGEDNSADKPDKGVPWWVWLIVAGVVVVVIILIALGIIYPGFGAVMLNILKFILAVLLFPFKLLAKLINAVSERRKATAAAKSDKPKKSKKPAKTKRKGKGKGKK